MPKPGGQRRCQPWVQLHRKDLSAALDQAAGQSTRAGPNFHNQVLGFDLRSRNNLA